jgi:hypothetical protein
MKLLRKAKGNFRFLFEIPEKLLFCRLLQLYPLLPSTHQQISRTGELAANELTQSLLHEALSEHHAESQTRIKNFLADPQRFQSLPHGIRLIVSVSDLEWLLQILNDLRVGSWVRLGSPARLDDFMPEDQNAVHYWTIELAGHFQNFFLAAVEGRLKCVPEKSNNELP